MRLILESEKVNIVTRAENYAARCADGDYAQAGITLLPWESIPATKRAELWARMLRGKVANANQFAP